MPAVRHSTGHDALQIGVKSMPIPTGVEAAQHQVACT
jgi:hypothetical protein